MLEEIFGILGINVKFDIDCDLLFKKVNELDEIIKKLEVMCDGLYYVVVCIVLSYLECLRFCWLMNFVVVGVIEGVVVNKVVK